MSYATFQGKVSILYMSMNFFFKKYTLNDSNELLELQETKLTMCISLHGKRGSLIIFQSSP